MLFSRAFPLMALALLPALAQAQQKPGYEKVNSALLSSAPRSEDYVMGDKGAPVVMVEYASLSCPHCAHFHKEVLPVLEKKYIEEGKLLYILRPFPLNDPALKAAELIDCVGEKEGDARYYTFARVLFDSQQQWAFDAGFMKSLQTFAAVGGVDQKQFQECTSNPQREMKILTIRQQGQKELGVDHTPYFFINGYRYTGEVTPEGMEEFIDTQLNKKAKTAPKKKSDDE